MVFKSDKQRKLVMMKLNTPKRYTPIQISKAKVLIKYEDDIKALEIKRILISNKRSEGKLSLSEFENQDIALSYKLDKLYKKYYNEKLETDRALK